MVSRVVLSAVDDSMKMQILKVNGLAMDDSQEIREGIERFQNYGFTGVPFKDAEGVVLYVGGRRDHGLAIAVDDRRYRLKGLQNGEVAVYTDEGDSITIKRGGTIQINGSTAIELNGNSDKVAMSSKVDDRIGQIWNALATWTPVPNDGGAALKTLIATILTADPLFPEPTGSDKVKLS